MIDMNTGLKSDTDEAINKFIIVTNKEEARKAMIVIIWMTPVIKRLFQAYIEPNIHILPGSKVYS